MQFRPSPIALEPCADQKAAVLSLLIRLPNGTLPYTPPGQSGKHLLTVLMISLFDSMFSRLRSGHRFDVGFPGPTRQSQKQQLCRQRFGIAWSAPQRRTQSQNSAQFDAIGLIEGKLDRWKHPVPLLPVGPPEKSIPSISQRFSALLLISGYLPFYLSLSR